MLLVRFSSAYGTVALPVRLKSEYAELRIRRRFRALLDRVVFAFVEILKVRDSSATFICPAAERRDPICAKILLIQICIHTHLLVNYVIP